MTGARWWFVRKGNVFLAEGASTFFCPPVWPERRWLGLASAFRARQEPFFHFFDARW